MEKFLTDRICLVTGGAQGVGWAISQALADYGAHVFVCDISLESLKRAHEELQTLPWADQITLSLCDVTQLEDIKKWISNIYRQHGRIDVLINNAIFVRWTNLADMSVLEAEQIMRVGYNGMLYTIKTVLPFMHKNGSGHIINMGSSAGSIFVAGPSAAYSAVKSAINAFTQILQIELKDSPVHVTLLRPNSIAGTEFFSEHVTPERLPRLGDFFPYLTPPDIAKTVIQILKKPKLIVDIPGYIRFFYIFFAFAPRLMRLLMTFGGSMRRDLGAVTWEYKSKD